MGKKQGAKKAAAKGKRATEEASSVVGKAVDVVSDRTVRGKAAIGGLVARGKDESQAALTYAKSAVDELVRLGVVQADRAQEAVHTVYERGTSKIGLGGDDAAPPATHEDIDSLRQEIAALRTEIKASRPAPARPASTARKPATPRAAAAKPAAKPATARGTTAARSTAAKPAAKRTPAKPAAAKPASGTTRRSTEAAPAPTPAPDVVPPAPGATGASGATSTGRRPAGGGT